MIVFGPEFCAPLQQLTSPVESKDAAPESFVAIFGKKGSNKRNVDGILFGGSDAIGE